MAAASLLLGGCASHELASNQRAFLERAPLPRIVARHEVLTAAQRQASTAEGDFAMLGLGSSMEPFYRAGTAVVVHPTSYHMLRRGMAVVYKSTRGSHVAHMLLRKTERGWLVMGLNNATPDSALVTEKNLVGVIRHAFAAAETSFEAPPGERTAALLPPREKVLFQRPGQ